MQRQDLDAVAINFKKDGPVRGDDLAVEVYIPGEVVPLRTDVFVQKYTVGVGIRQRGHGVARMALGMSIVSTVVPGRSSSEGMEKGGRGEEDSCCR